MQRGARSGLQRSRKKKKPASKDRLFMARKQLVRSALRRRYVALSGIGAFTEEVLFRLLQQVLACARISHVQAVFVDQHGLLLEPALPCFLRNRFIDPLAEFSRQGRKVESFGFLAEFRALNRSGHLYFSCSGVTGRLASGGAWVRLQPDDHASK